MPILLGVLTAGVWIARMQTYPMVRLVQGLPEGEYGWIIREDQGHLFLVSFTKNLRLLPQTQRFSSTARSLDLFPFLVYQIDPETEQVIERFQSKHLSAIGIRAQREQSADSWLAQEYDEWVIDNHRNLAYALKPTRWEELGTYGRYWGLDIVDLQQKQVKAKFPFSEITALALSSDGQKLYVAAGGAGTDGTGESAPGVAIVSTQTLTVTKTVSLISDHSPEHMVFTKDGKQLICGSRRGLLFIDTQTDIQRDELKYPLKHKGLVYYYTYDKRMHEGLTLSPDEKEIYIGLRLGEKKGAVAAIDIKRRTIVRKLELSKTGCGSVAVAKGKLFAACLDGVYVIDIDRWRMKK